VSKSKPTAKHATDLVDVEATLGVGVEVLDLRKLGCVLVERIKVLVGLERHIALMPIRNSEVVEVIQVGH
jgi:hypothetical protein